MSSACDLSLKSITKRFGDTTAVDDISFEVARSEWLSLVGPSGCGKSTTLRIIAGFISADCGELKIKDVDLTHAPPHRRNTAMVFQNYALFPHMTVAENVGYGLRLRRVSRSEIDRRVRAALTLVQLDGYGERYPTREMSGGQQQRVALARAIVIEPDVLLLDEPLSNLDARLREDLRVEMAELHRRVGLATIYVTHDQEEALSMSSRVAVMNRGRIEQIGSPEDIYDRPATLFVADFIGKVNTLPGRVIAAELGGKAEVSVDLQNAGSLVLRARANPLPAIGAAVKVAFRAERVRICGFDSVDREDNQFSGTVRNVAYYGNSIRYKIALGDDAVVSVIQGQASRSRLRLGELARLSVNFEDCLLFA
jgi:ABC-type Fe3+/spermidine/putrescine transport system ATPase subunit